MPQPARSGPYDVIPSGARGCSGMWHFAVCLSCCVLHQLLQRLLLPMGQGPIR